MKFLLVTISAIPVVIVSLCLASHPPYKKVDVPKHVSVMNEPDHFAWKVFCEITESKPIAPQKAGWETWISAFRLFADPMQCDFIDPRARLNNGKYDAKYLTDIDQGQFVSDTDSGQLTADGVKVGPSNSTAAAVTASGKRPFISTTDGGTSSPREDVALNPEAVKYILENNLISTDLQQTFVTQGGSTISFPKEAKEIKIMWKKLDPSEYSRYYTEVDDRAKVVWGLQSMHITTKDIPNWFWATFEHHDNYGPGVPFLPSDNWGFKNNQATLELKALLKAHNLDVDLWTQNYRLGGSQVDFTDGAGKPIIRGNNLIEGMQAGSPATQSSCMTCHSRSTVGNRLDFHLQDDRVGSPNWRWFFGVGYTGNLAPSNVQRDFVWSLSRAKHEIPDSPPEGIFWSIANKKEISFDDDIAPLFLVDDIKAMQKLTINLWDYKSVYKHKETIFDHYAHKTKPYLPLKMPKWSDYLLQEYQLWLKEGAVKTPAY